MRRSGWSAIVEDPDQVQALLTRPHDLLDVRVDARPGPPWDALGFVRLEPTRPRHELQELVRPLEVGLVGVAATRALGARLARHLRPGDLLVLSGPLGAGKTALTQGLGAALGIQGRVTSPTFVLARRHDGPVPLLHVDAYRLRRPDGTADLRDLEDLDLDRDDAVTVVEWGQDLLDDLTEDRLHVGLDRPSAGPATDGGPGAVPGPEAADSEASRRTARILAQGGRWSALRPR